MLYAQQKYTYLIFVLTSAVVLQFPAFTNILPLILIIFAKLECFQHLVLPVRREISGAGSVPDFYFTLNCYPAKAGSFDLGQTVFCFNWCPIHIIPVLDPRFRVLGISGLRFFLDQNDLRTGCRSARSRG